MGTNTGQLSQAGNMAARANRGKADFSREMGLNLQRLCLERGLSQERLAHMAGISSYTYQKFEKGESKPGTPMNPRLFTLMALAEVLQVRLTELVPEDWPDLTEGR